MADVKLKFKHSQLIESGWTLAKENDGTLVFERPIVNPFVADASDATMTIILALHADGTDVLTMTLHLDLWDNEAIGERMRLAFSRAGAQYTVEVM